MTPDPNDHLGDSLLDGDRAEREIESDLKPCPWCASEKVFIQNSDMPKSSGGYCPMVWCSSCGARTGERMTDTEAIAAWNTRAPRPNESEKPVAWVAEKDLQRAHNPIGAMGDELVAVVHPRDKWKTPLFANQPVITEATVDDLVVKVGQSLFGADWHKPTDADPYPVHSSWSRLHAAISIIAPIAAPRPSVSPEIEGLKWRGRELADSIEGRFGGIAVTVEDVTITVRGWVDEAAAALTALAEISTRQSAEVESAERMYRSACSRADHAEACLEAAIAQRDLLSGEVERLRTALEKAAVALETARDWAHIHDAMPADVAAKVRAAINPSSQGAGG